MIIKIIKKMKKKKKKRSLLEVPRSNRKFVESGKNGYP
jgi:hypothetical protein